MSLSNDFFYTEKVSKIGIWAKQKLSWLNDHQHALISHISLFMTVQLRDLLPKCRYLNQLKVELAFGNTCI